ncbi:MAG: 23S rRNA (guanosine(2251)-2'-O)-methyltransferase RlmB [Acidobacteriota bacterium]
MIIYGINPVTEALKAQGRKIDHLLVTRGKSSPRLQELIDLARNRGIPVRFERPEVLDRLAETSRHQDILADVAAVAYSSFEDILETSPQLLLLVDGVEDPRNLGALLRTAEATGVGGVLLPERHSCGVTPLVVKASAGAALHLKTAQIGNVSQTLKTLKEEGFWTVGLDMSGRHRLQDLDPTLPLVVVLGGEHRGVRRLVREQCDFLVSLPMKGRVTSLNLSVAAGVLLYHLSAPGSPTRPPEP